MSGVVRLLQQTAQQQQHWRSSCHINSLSEFELLGCTPSHSMSCVVRLLQHKMQQQHSRGMNQ
jgi:hypothetical protein